MMNHFMIIAQTKWKIVFDNLYERYPYPCLYYSLLYGNSKELLSRIGHKFIYSYKIHDELSIMLVNMLTSLSDNKCPSNVRMAIYIVAPIFMKAVSANEWGEIFEQIYNSSELNDPNKDQNYLYIYENFIFSGVKYSTNKKFKQSILLSNLSFGKKNNYFRSRLIIAAMQGFKSKEINEKEQKELNKLVEKADSTPQYYVLLNMKNWIDKDLFFDTFPLIDDKYYNNYILLLLAIDMSKEDETIQNKLKQIIINHPYLWETGINKYCTGFEDHITYIFSISKMQGNISFNTDEVVEIYDKMLSSLNKISTLFDNAGDDQFLEKQNFLSYIIIEMNVFLNNNKAVLSNEKDYYKTNEKVNSLLDKLLGSHEIPTLIIRDKETEKVIDWMVKNIIISSDFVKENQYSYIVIANKLLSQKSEYLNSCFVHFGWAIEKYTNKFNKDIFKNILENILISYEPYFCGDNELEWDILYAQKEVVEHELIKMYDVYKNWGGKSEFWEKYEKRYKYNDLIYL